jgi:hypothetical protein
MNTLENTKKLGELNSQIKLAKADILRDFDLIGKCSSTDDSLKKSIKKNKRIISDLKSKILLIKLGVS